ncbi:MAG: hypothetical protein WEC83_00630 [Patescibacteria group bacterium]
MAKKRSKNIQRLLAKKQQLQRLQETSSPEALPSPLPAELPAISAPAELPALPAGSNRPVIRTLASVAVVAIILVGLTVTAQSNQYLASFGDWLYLTLELGVN